MITFRNKTSLARCSRAFQRYGFTAGHLAYQTYCSLERGASSYGRILEKAASICGWVSLCCSYFVAPHVPSDANSERFFGHRYHKETLIEGYTKRAVIPTDAQTCRKIGKQFAVARKCAQATKKNVQTTLTSGNWISRNPGNGPSIFVFS